MRSLLGIVFLLAHAGGVSSAKARNCIPDWVSLRATVSGAPFTKSTVYTLCPETVFQESGQIRFRVNATVECGPSGSGSNCVIEPAVHDLRNRRSSFFLVASRPHTVQPHVTFVGLTMQKYYGRVGSSAVTVAGYDTNPEGSIHQYGGGATFVDCVFRDNAGPYSTAVRGTCAPHLLFQGCTFTGRRYLGIYLGIYIGASSSSACGSHGSLDIQDSVFEDYSGSIYFHGLETLSVVNSCFLGNIQQSPYSWFEDITVQGSWPTVTDFENNYSDGADSSAAGNLIFQHSLCGPRAPSSAPSSMPTDSQVPSTCPTRAPSLQPSLSQVPSVTPSLQPSKSPSAWPSIAPSISAEPSGVPSLTPSLSPSYIPSDQPSDIPSMSPSDSPSNVPSQLPSLMPSSRRPSPSAALTNSSGGYRIHVGLLTLCFTFGVTLILAETA